MSWSRRAAAVRPASPPRPVSTLAPRPGGESMPARLCCRCHRRLRSSSRSSVGSGSTRTRRTPCLSVGTSTCSSCVFPEAFCARSSPLATAHAMHSRRLPSPRAGGRSGPRQVADARRGVAGVAPRRLRVRRHAVRGWAHRVRAEGAAEPLVTHSTPPAARPPRGARPRARVDPPSTHTTSSPRRTPSVPARTRSPVSS